MPHTQGKLHVNDDGLPKINILSEEGFRVAVIHWGHKHGNVWMEREEAEANAAHLALCWNSHDELVEALKTIHRSSEIAGGKRILEFGGKLGVYLNLSELEKIEQALKNAGAL